MDRNIHVSRTNPNHSDFRGLIALLDEQLSINNGADDAFFAQFNQTEEIKHVVVAYIDGKAVGCGAIKPYEEGTAEVKRMFVHPEFRRLGIAKSILGQLETWALELQYSNCILETAKELEAAVALYQQSGYQVIPNYGPYQTVARSICMQKKLKDLSPVV